MTKHKKLNKKVLIIALVAVLLIGGGYALQQSRNNSNQSKNTKIDYKPATKDDQKRADDNKSRIVDQDTKQAAADQKPQASGSALATAIPVISYAALNGDTVYVNGGVNNLFEDGGTCTATFSKGGATFSKTSNANKNVSSVDCTEIAVKSTDFPNKGDWNLTLSYKSATSAGSSEAKQINVR